MAAALTAAGVLVALGDVQITAHPYRRAEAGLGLGDDREPDFLVETCGGPRNYLQAARGFVRCPSGSVFDERAANPPVHMVRLDEEPVELVDCVVGWDDNRETERSLVAGDGDADPTVLDEALRQRNRVRVGCELLPIGFPNRGGAPL